MRIRKSCGVSELRILVTKSLHSGSAFDDFERLGTIVIQPKRLRGFDEFPASSGERFQDSLLQAEFTLVWRRPRYGFTSEELEGLM